MTKRLFDIVMSGFALVVLSPFLLWLAFLIGRKLGSPVTFKQMRPGVRGEPFELVKFRTMTNATDSSGKLLPDDQRITEFGRFLRSTSLDELPELWNVFKGDMSLVGPRPLLMQYVPRYTPEQARRHEVRPGLTGWVQVKGRNALSWEQKFALDVWYVDHRTFLLDLQIIFATVWSVVTRHGISAEGYATMPEFMGSASGNDAAEHGDSPRAGGAD